MKAIKSCISIVWLTCVLLAASQSVSVTPTVSTTAATSATPSLTPSSSVPSPSTSPSSSIPSVTRSVSPSLSNSRSTASNSNSTILGVGSSGDLTTGAIVGISLGGAGAVILVIGALIGYKYWNTAPPAAKGTRFPKNYKKGGDKPATSATKSVVVAQAGAFAFEEEAGADPSAGVPSGVDQFTATVTATATGKGAAHKDTAAAVPRDVVVDVQPVADGAGQPARKHQKRLKKPAHAPTEVEPEPEESSQNLDSDPAPPPKLRRNRRHSTEGAQPHHHSHEPHKRRLTSRSGERHVDAGDRQLKEVAVKALRGEVDVVVDSGHKGRGRRSRSRGPEEYSPRSRSKSREPSPSPTRSESRHRRSQRHSSQETTMTVTVDEFQEKLAKIDQRKDKVRRLLNAFQKFHEKKSAAMTPSRSSGQSTLQPRTPAHQLQQQRQQFGSHPSVRPTTVKLGAPAALPLQQMPTPQHFGYGPNMMPMVPPQPPVPSQLQMQVQAADASDMVVIPKATLIALLASSQASTNPSMSSKSMSSESGASRQVPRKMTPKGFTHNFGDEVSVEQGTSIATPRRTGRGAPRRSLSAIKDRRSGLPGQWL